MTATVRIHMTTNVRIYMTANVRMHMNTNVRPRLRMCGRFLSEDPFPRYHDFLDLQVPPNVPDAPFFGCFPDFFGTSESCICPVCPDNMFFHLNLHPDFTCTYESPSDDHSPNIQKVWNIL